MMADRHGHGRAAGSLGFLHWGEAGVLSLSVEFATHCRTSA